MPCHFATPPATQAGVDGGRRNARRHCRGMPPIRFEASYFRDAGQRQPRRHFITLIAMLHGWPDIGRMAPERCRDKTFHRTISFLVSRFMSREQDTSICDAGLAAKLLMLRGDARWRRCRPAIMILGRAIFAGFFAATPSGRRAAAADMPPMFAVSASDARHFSPPAWPSLAAMLATSRLDDNKVRDAAVLISGEQCHAPRPIVAVDAKKASHDAAARPAERRWLYARARLAAIAGAMPRRRVAKRPIACSLKRITRVSRRFSPQRKKPSRLPPRLDYFFL